MSEVRGQRIPRHGVRILVVWAVLSAIAIPLVLLVLGPHLPPGRMSNEASAQTDANTRLTALLTPILQGSIAFVRHIDEAAGAMFALQHEVLAAQGIPVQGVGRQAYRS